MKDEGEAGKLLSFIRAIASTQNVSSLAASETHSN
jgi:hypothetical protein